MPAALTPAPIVPLRPVRIALGFGLAALTYLLCRYAAGLDDPAAITAGVTALCAAWWCTEAVPIPVTSLVPFAVFPFAGILDHGQLAAAYGDKFILLFMGGFMLSRAAERSNTHLRVAHGMMKLVGAHSRRRIVVGFMLATAFCSMWISNTATALIMLPVAIAVLDEHTPGHGARESADPRDPDHRFAVSLLLAIAYGASIGGVATLIGTPPNGVFASVYQTTANRTVGFTDWLPVGLPIAAIMLIATAAVLTLRLPGRKKETGVRGQESEASDTRPGAVLDLGPWTPAQRRTLGVLSVTALLWITRNAPFGGWSDWFDMPKAHDATIALAAVVACFLIPAGRRGQESGVRGQESEDDGPADSGPLTPDSSAAPAGALLDWKTARDIPWGILLLFGGGIALAQAFQVTHLADHIGKALAGLADFPPVLTIGVICLVVTFMTEVTSNTATTTLLMPILAATAAGAGLDPAAFMIPAALSASCAFMLPVATPPNAIVFASPLITIPQMARVGFTLNLIGVLVITAVCHLVIDRHDGIGTPNAPAAAQTDPTPAPDHTPATTPTR